MDSENIFYFLKNHLLIYFFERQSYRGRGKEQEREREIEERERQKQREKERGSICWFIFQMASMDRFGLIWSQFLSSLSQQHRSPSFQAIFCRFPRSLAGSWIWSGSDQMKTGNLSCFATIPQHWLHGKTVDRNNYVRIPRILRVFNSHLISFSTLCRELIHNAIWLY